MDDFTTSGGSTSHAAAISRDKGYGRAALLLVESLMHALVEKDLLSKEEFIKTVEAAAEVEEELVSSGASLPSNLSGSPLYPIAHAFRTELGR